MKNLFIVATIGLTLFVISCGSPIRPIYQVVAEEEMKAEIDKQKAQRKQELVEEKRRELTTEEKEQLDKELKALQNQIQKNTEQKIASYDREVDQITKELLKKKPNEMTEEEFQTYLLIEQRNIAEQHAKNARKWQVFDIVMRVVIPPAAVALVIIGTILAGD